MSAYTTSTAVRSATGFANSTNISDALIDGYIADASSIIDGKICDAYVLPLPQTPQLIETICRHITVALLYMNEYGEESENLDKGWKNRMAWAMEQLEAIKKQDTKLIGESSPYVGSELPRSSLKQPTFLPNDTTSDPNYTDPTGPKITINEQF